jgi:hypothetical protein
MIDNPLLVHQSAYMNFKEATDGLFNRISHEELADALSISVASIRQARLDPKAKAYREPPKNWKGALIQLAEARVWHYRKLIEQVRKSGGV